jgi:UDP-2-acetamido-3-amino-2,3-dideoxy-glucuronate N-acetyltransferase
MSIEALIHPLASVGTQNLGINTSIWQYVVILPGARVGDECNICSHCFIENDVVIGNRVTIKSGVQLWDGLRVGDDVFIGPNASFANDRFPRSKQRLAKFLETHIDDGASIGSGAVILPGLKIGRKAMIGAGSVVTRSVPPYAIVRGNPARIFGYVDTEQSEAEFDDNPRRREPMRQLSTVPGVSLVQMPRVVDIRGSLTVGEVRDAVPFDIKRYFIVFDVPSIETRGEHAHRKCHQFLVCPCGSCVVVVDDGVYREEFVLDRPELGLHLPPMVWGIQYKYSHDAALLVFASENYDPADYIRDYNEFLNVKGLK